MPSGSAAFNLEHSTFNPRSGATLVEILMSTLIMSVGMTAVIGLFPLSLVSSLRATQFTNAKLLEENVVEILRTNPQLVYPPIDTESMSPMAWDTTSREWRPNTTYVADTVVMPRIPAGQHLPSPFNIAVVTAATGNSGLTVNHWPLSGTMNDLSAGGGGLGVQWTLPNLTSTITVGGIPLQHQHYIVDPLGRHRDGADTTVAFGSDGQTNAVQAGSLIRTDGGLGSYILALPYFSLPDSWSVEFEGVPSMITPGAPTIIDFPSTVQLPNVGPTVGRVVLTDAAGQDVRIGTLSSAISGTSISLMENFPATLVGNLRIETFDPRYTYFITVRRSSLNSHPKFTAVVVFNRSFSPLDERLIPATTVSGSDSILVNWPVVTGAKSPLIKEGGYMFDAVNCEWYQIVDAPSGDLAAGVNHTIVLNRPIDQATTGVIFMPGIVHVFDIEL